MATARIVPFVLSSPSVASGPGTFVRSALRRRGASEIIPRVTPSARTARIPRRAAGPAAPVIRVSYEQSYVEHAETIEGVLTMICRRHRLAGMEADDFRSLARLKLVDNDYEVLRKFQGRSSLRTYLTIVIERVFLDYRNAQWGKWRPSAEAQRQGPIALRLEQLIGRDGFTFDESVEILRSQYGARESRDELSAIAAKLPVRFSRKAQGEEVLAHLQDPGESPDVLVERKELRPQAVAARAALEHAIAALDDQDRLIIRLKFVNGLGVVDIARMLQLEQRPLYRRIDQILARLRLSLESQGVTAETAARLLSETWSDLASPQILETNFGKPHPRPSM